MSSRTLRSSQDTAIMDNQPIALTRQDLETCLAALREDIKNDTSVMINELQRVIQQQAQQIEQLRNAITTQEKETKTLKSVIANQAITIEKLETEKNKEFGVISGLPENDKTTPINTALKQLAQDINIEEAIIDATFVPYRLGKFQSNKSRPVKVKFTSSESKIKFAKKIHEAKLNNRISNIIYCNFDYPILTRQENSRLRKKMKEEKQKTPNVSFKIAKGKLYRDNIEIDSFDLENQIFR